MSTFMVEMTETATSSHATRASLVILDEVGRDVDVDGLSIAQAVVEYLHDSPRLGCRTLFATHYHELTALAERLPRVRNQRVEVLEKVRRCVSCIASCRWGRPLLRHPRRGLAGLPSG